MLVNNSIKEIHLEVLQVLRLLLQKIFKVSSCKTIEVHTLCFPSLSLLNVSYLRSPIAFYVGPNK